MFRVVPGSVVYYPSCANSAAKAVELSANRVGIDFLRFTLPIISRGGRNRKLLSFPPLQEFRLNFKPTSVQEGGLETGLHVVDIQPVASGSRQQNSKLGEVKYLAFEVSNIPG